MAGLVDDNPSLGNDARRLKAFTRFPNIFPLDVHDWGINGWLTNVIRDL